MRILIVDDDQLARYVLYDELTAAGYEVIQAADGQQAWSIVEQQGVQFIITDWNMPRLDGVGLIREVREANLPRYTYIILLTTRTEPEEIVQGLRSGADDYLDKSFDIQELLARIRIGERILALESQLIRDSQRLTQIATQDPLTGLRNRQGIMAHAEKEFARASRESKPLSLILLDIDHFQQVNDRYGQTIGDQLIWTVGNRLDRSLRPYDRLGRWSAREFLIVLTDTSLAQAKVVAERLQTRVDAAPLPVPDGGELSISTTLGVSGTANGQPILLRSLLWQAEEALRRGKAEGGKRVRAYTSSLYVLKHPERPKRRAVEAS